MVRGRVGVSWGGRKPEAHGGGGTRIARGGYVEDRRLVADPLGFGRAGGDHLRLRAALPGVLQSAGVGGLPAPGVPAGTVGGAGATHAAAARRPRRRAASAGPGDAERADRAGDPTGSSAPGGADVPAVDDRVPDRLLLLRRVECPLPADPLGHRGDLRRRAVPAADGRDLRDDRAAGRPGSGRAGGGLRDPLERRGAGRPRGGGWGSPALAAPRTRRWRAIPGRGPGGFSGPPIEGATALPMGYDGVARSISARTTPSAGR